MGIKIPVSHLAFFCFMLFVFTVLISLGLYNQFHLEYTENPRDVIYYKANDTCIIINNSYYYNTTMQQIYTTQTTTIVKPQNELQQVAKDVADDYIYEANVFDCTQFCDELKLRLEQRGYTNLKRKTVILDCSNLDMEGYSMDVDGCYKFKGRHDILKLGDWGFMECTNGFIISPKDYDKYGLVA